MGRVSWYIIINLFGFKFFLGCTSGFSTWRRVSVGASGQNQMRYHGCTVSSTSPAGQSLTRLAWFEHGTSTQQLVAFIVFPKFPATVDWGTVCLFQGFQTSTRNEEASRDDRLVSTKKTSVTSVLDLPVTAREILLAIVSEFGFEGA